MNFTDTSYAVFRSLIIVEFIGTIVALLIVGMAFYLVAKVPQFHRNLIGLIGNMTVAFLVVAFGRLMEIGGEGFDPHIDSITRTIDNYPFFFINDLIRAVAINSYVFTNLLMAIERTLATIMLKSYEDFKHPCIIVPIILASWLAGLGMQLLMYLGYFPTVLWEIMAMLIICLSLIVSLVL
jgi:hypothetical protein